MVSGVSGRDPQCAASRTNSRPDDRREESAVPAGAEGCSEECLKQGMSGVAPRLLLAVLMMTAGPLSFAPAADTIRETPLVRAVRQSRLSVVNIHTEKNAAEDRDARFLLRNPGV